MNPMQLTKPLSALLLVLAATSPLTAWADTDEDIRVARYSVVAPVPRAAQADPLSALVSVTFPEQLQTVGEALRYTLRRSGYLMAAPEASDPAVEVLQTRSLPAVHRDLGPMPLERILTTLAGPAWVFVVDPVHRLVSFELASGYKTIATAYIPTGPEPAESPETDDEEEEECYGGGETWTWGPGI